MKIDQTSCSFISRSGSSSGSASFRLCLANVAAIGLLGALFVTVQVPITASATNIGLPQSYSVPGGASSVSAYGSNVWVAGDGWIAKVNFGGYVLATDRTLGKPLSDISTYGNSVWATDTRDTKVIEFNANSLAVENTISVSTGPSKVAVFGNDVWVSRSTTDFVSLIDAGFTSPRVIATVQVGKHPSGIAVTGNEVWVVNSASTSISEINALSDSVINTVTVGGHPETIAVDGGYVWVTSSGDTVTKIQASTGQIVATISVTGSSAGIAALNGNVWVVSGTNTLSGINVTTDSISTRSVGSDPSGVSVFNNTVWVVNQGSSSISKVVLSSAPGNPSNVYGRPGNGEVLLTWTAPTVTGSTPITSYKVQYSSNNGSTWVTTTSCSGAMTRCTVGGLSNGLHYIFRVAAINAVGMSSYSATSLPIIPTYASNPASSTTPYVKATIPISHIGTNLTAFGGRAWIEHTRLWYTSASLVAELNATSGSEVATLAFGPVVVYSLGSYGSNLFLNWGFEDSYIRELDTSTTPPKMVLTFAEGGHISVVGNHLWLGTTHSVRDYDLSGPSPSLKGQYDLRYFSGCFSSVGKYLWAGSSAGGGSSTNFIGEFGPKNSTSTLRIVAKVNLPGGPCVVSGKDLWLWRPNYATGRGTLLEVNDTSGEIVKRVSVTTVPNGYLSLFGNDVWLKNTSNNKGLEFNTTTGALVAQVPVGKGIGPIVAQDGYVWFDNNTYQDTTTPNVTGSSVTEVIAPTTSSAPQNVAVLPKASAVNVSWTPPVLNGGTSISDYRVQYSVNAGLTWTTGPLCTGSGSSCTVTGLSNGSAYVFRVLAQNSSGFSVPSTVSTAAIPVSLPQSPTNVSTVRGNAKISVHWTVPLNNGGSAITAFKVQYSKTTGASWVTATTCVTTTTHCTVTGLVVGTKYIFRVLGENALGSSSYSSASPSVVDASAPGIPTGLSAVKGNRRVSLQWTPPVTTGAVSLTGYQVCWSSTSSAVGTCTQSSTFPNISSVSITGLLNGTAYYFEVRAKNIFGPSLFSTKVSAIPSTIPAAPSLTSVVTANNKILLSWTAPLTTGGAAITAYQICWSTKSSTVAGCGHKVTLASVTGGSVTSLTNGNVYYFAVRAKNSNGFGPLSPTKTGIPSTIPIAPSLSKVSGGYKRVNVVWTTPNTTGGAAISGYQVCWAVTAAAVAACSSAKTFGLITSGTISTLTEGSKYYFVVRARNINGFGPLSTSLTATTVTTPPLAPSITKTTSGNGKVTLTWSAPTNGGYAITGYEVCWSSSSGTETSCNHKSTFSGVTSGAISSLLNGTTYYFEIRAENSLGYGSLSSQVSSMPVSTVPSAPTLSKVTAGNAKVTLTWSAPTNGGSAITGYEVCWSTKATTVSSCSSKKTFAVVLTGSVTSLVNGTPYYFAIKAKNVNGYSALSMQLNAKPSTVPSAPTLSKVTAGNAKVTLTWIAPSNGGSAITGYEVCWSSSSGTETSCNHKATFGNVLSGSISTLSNGAEYFFMIRAENSNGYGPFSAQKTAKPVASSRSRFRLYSSRDSRHRVLFVPLK